MSTTATKLTYLNDTKQLLKENINSLGGNLTTEPFRQYASVLEGIYERIPKVSGIGSNLSLSPTMAGKIKLNEIQGNTLQNGTPTPSSPVPIQNVTGLQNVGVCGKNLINGLLDNSTTGKKLERTINADENFYLYIKTNNTTSDRCYAFLDNTIVGTIWVSNNNGTLTFSGSRNFTFNRIRIQDNTTVSENMLTLGSATTYEPYKGNTYEVNLGKNLLDSSTLQDGYITNTGTINSSHPLGEMYSDYIKTLPNTTYIFKIFETSSSNENWFGIGEYTSTNESSFLRRDAETTGTRRYCIFTTSSTTNYIRVSARNLAGATKVQLELGNATTYSPYFTPIELNKIGNYQDRIYKDNGKWYVEKNIGKVLLDGSENWTDGSTNIFNVEDILPPHTYSTYSVNVLCDSYLGIIGYASNSAFVSGTTNIDYACSLHSNGTTIRFKDIRYTSKEDLKTWLGTHNAALYFQLATPTTTEITNTELIEDLETLYTAKSKEGTTNISIISENLPMIISASALKSE